MIKHGRWQNLEESNLEQTPLLLPLPFHDMTGAHITRLFNGPLLGKMIVPGAQNFNN
jgi:hypothetical protein